MRHLTVTEFGQFLGMSGARLQVQQDGQIINEYPLSRLRTISIAKKGVSFSSNLLLACAERGIRLFLLDWRGVSVASLSGNHQHAVVRVRQEQFRYLEQPQARSLAAEMLHGKVRNQRAVLSYFNKSLKRPELDATSKQLAQHAIKLKNGNWLRHEQWREELMGLEGSAANLYWKSMQNCNLLPASFIRRHGRGANDIANQALNFGYTLLSSYVWHALSNAGLEIYAGILHVQRPGKPALVLDIMEEYRAWVVDRNVIKLREKMSETSELTPAIKKQLGFAIHKTFATRYPYKKSKMRLESILQRQCYRLAGVFVEQKKYIAYRFKW
jgi:CRISPR-associated protein Cas1